MTLNIEKEKILTINNGYLLGVLASENDNLPHLGYDKTPITIMKNSSNVVAYIKPISEEPEYVKNNINPYVPSKQIYINVDVHNKSLGIYNLAYTTSSEYDKCKYNEKIFKNKIVIFRPYLSVAGDKIHKNVTLVKLIENNEIDVNAQYLGVPIIKGTSEEFEKNLEKEKRIIINDGIMECSQDEYVICGNKFYGEFDGWYKAYGYSNGWMCEGKENVTSIDLDFSDNEFKKNVIIVNNEIAFVNKSYLTILDYKLMNQGNILYCDNRYESSKLNDSNVDAETCLESGSSIKDHNNTENIIIDLPVKSECNILNKFKNMALSKGLFYEFSDLINFHISMKINSLTIVAGMTGTGKTQIAKCYAELLGLQESNLLFLPISPSYTEPQDVLGYLNTSTGLYTPSETGLVDMLVKAVNNPDDMHMVIFDEMNLSQIEHWFAPFLSLLELPKHDRYLSLYGCGQICHNSIKYPASIKIPDNILFVGTVNLDETTKDFSDRVLDRANVIELRKNGFKQYYDAVINTEIAFDLECVNINQKIGYAEFSSWVKESNGLKDLNVEEVIFLDELNNLLQKEDNQKGVSFRLIEKISNYLANIPENVQGIGMISRSEGFDLMLKQRFLTKMRGSERQLDGIISPSCNSLMSESPLYSLFDSQQAKFVSEFNLVKSKIKSKEKELDKYGYTN